MTGEFKQITSFDRLIHEPSRLAIMAVLYASEGVDFKYLLNAPGLTKGNLSAHLRKLETPGYLEIKKSFKGNYPHTSAALTHAGRKAFEAYRKQYLKLAKQLGDD